MAITAGCNQAFCLAMAALARPGDQVVLPLPYYFNHRMWLDATGIEALHPAFRPDAGGVPDVEEVARLITDRTRAIVLVTPNNPTGAIYPAETLRAFYDLAKRRGIALVLDETYIDFLPTDDRPHDLFEDPDWASTVVHLYSFSKVFAITGHRVGALTAGPALMAQIEKAMDCVAICAPRIGPGGGAVRAGAARRLGPGQHRVDARAGDGVPRLPCHSWRAGAWSAWAPSSPISSIPSPAATRSRWPAGWRWSTIC